MSIGTKLMEAREGSPGRDRLILDRLPQVKLIASRIHYKLPGSVCLDDLISAGVLGLIDAVDHFDPSLNVKLRTYAEHKIRGAILDSLRSLDWAPHNTRRKSKLSCDHLGGKEAAEGGHRGGSVGGAGDLVCRIPSVAG